MLSPEDNETLTRVGPGTPGGELLRRYWHPIHPEALLRENPVTKVRILGEDLVLFRDRSGRLGLVGERCPHRRISLSVGIPEENGLRCCYHGWLFDHCGQCLEQPLEPPESQFKERIRITAYPVEEMGGLVWAYLGPDPAPLLPRWDLFVRPEGFRQIVGHRLPCNWLQVMENRGDLGHAVYTHGRLFQYVLEREGRLVDDPKARYNAAMAEQQKLMERGAYVKYRPVWNEFGFTKGRMISDDPDGESKPAWQIGINPILFPYILASGPGDAGVRIRRSYQIGVPVDDTNTWHFQYFCYVFPDEVDVPAQDRVPYAEVPLRGDDGNYRLDYVLGQDMVAWHEQGAISDREHEHLGTTDRLVIAYRKLLAKQIEIVAGGGEPMNVFRDPGLIDSPELRIPGNEGTSPLRQSELRDQLSYRENFHKFSPAGWRYIEDDADRYCPDKDLILELFEQAEKALAARPAPPLTTPG
jgi:5,5'-dehydrodivanillate O-demethylase oxygenase subunit